MRKLKKNMMIRKKGQITLGGFEIGLTLVMLFGLFFALSLYMFFSSSSAKENSVDLSLEIARISSAQDNLRINIFTTGNFEFDVDDYIKNSRVLEGKVISTCFDYLREDYCIGDVVGVARPQTQCKWFSGKCVVFHSQAGGGGFR